MKKLFSGLLLVALSAICIAESSTSPGSSQRYIMVNPESRIRVGFDYDGDNRVDEYRNLRGSDLMARMPQRPGVYDTLSTPSPDAMPMNTLTGRIEDLKQVRLSGLGQRHVVARVKTESDSFYTVDLGPRDQVNQLDLETGDWISVRGVQGSINRHKTLMAMQVSTDNQQTDIIRPRGSDQLRFAGKIRERTVRSLGPSRPDHLIALVELENEEKVVVDLGSSEELKDRDIKLSDNERIVFLARPAEFAGKYLLRATRLSADGEIVQTSL